MKEENVAGMLGSWHTQAGNADQAAILVRKATTWMQLRQTILDHTDQSIAEQKRVYLLVPDKVMMCVLPHSVKDEKISW